MKKTYLMKTALSAIVLILLSASGIWAQQRAVSGQVTDSQGVPVVGALVTVEGTTQGVVTDVDGNYRLTVAGDATLTVSSLGYLTETVAVASRSVVSVVLREDAQSIEDVVIVGFGSQKRVNLTGSIGFVDAKAFETRPVSNAVTALQGEIPGLNITTSGLGGTLDATRSINVRGTATIGRDSNNRAFSSGDPLVIIDGMQGDLNTINPRDIESISVLKDAASAAIYGSRGAFGVILVTTKRGTEGRANVSYNADFRFKTPTKMPTMQNSWEFVNYFGDAMQNQNSPATFYTETERRHVKDYLDGKPFDGQGSFDPLRTMISPNEEGYRGTAGKYDYDHPFANVDWLSEYYKKWTSANEHNLTVSGGTRAMNYYVSGNFSRDNGNLRYGTETRDRYNLNMKLSGQVTSWLKVDAASNFATSSYDRPRELGDGLYDNVMRRARPVRPKYDNNGFPMNDVNYIGVLRDAGRVVENNDINTYQLGVTITPLKGWNIRGEYNYRITNRWSHNDTYMIYTYMPDGINKYPAALSASSSSVSEESRRTSFENFNVYTDYIFNLNDAHNFKVMVGFQTEEENYRNVSASRIGLTTNSLPVLALTSGTHDVTGASTPPSIGGVYEKWATAGFFGRFNYDYKGRYLFEFNGRYDGSSRFRKDRRWVFTPSFSMGWNVTEEPFWPTNRIVTQLKPRFSYGVSANQATQSRYPTYLTMGTGAANGRWLVGDSRPNTAQAPGIVSNTLTWERVEGTNIGLDWAMFNNKLTGSFDYYVRNTFDSMGPGTVLPATLGTQVPTVNNTDLKTYGWELSLGWRDNIKNKFRYGVRASLSDSQSKVLKYPNPTQAIGNYNAGQKLGEIWGFTTVGIARSNEEMDAHLATLPNGGQSAINSNWKAGDVMYADINDDGKVDSGASTLLDPGDRKIIGNSSARYRIGINIDMQYTGFDFRMFWQGVLKRDWSPGDNSGDGMMFWGVNSGGEWWSTAIKEHLDYFRADANHPLGQNLDSYYPRPVMGNNKNQRVQTRYILNGAYLRLSNVQFGYTLPSAWVSKIGLKSLRVFFSGENLAVLTSVPIIDPESIGIGRQGGATYPLPSTYSFGAQINF